jgi:transcriptional regulator with XRE-family HTH domain
MDHKPAKQTQETPESREESVRLAPYWRKAKNELGLTQVKLAEILGVGQSSITRWLNGKQPIPNERLIELATILRFDPTEIRPELARYVRPLADLTLDERAIATARMVANLDEQSRTAVETYILFLSAAPTKQRAPEE